MTDNSISNKVTAYAQLKRQSENQLNVILFDINQHGPFFKVMCKQDTVLGVFTSRTKADEFIIKLTEYVESKKMPTHKPMRIKCVDTFTSTSVPASIDDVSLDRAFITYSYS